MRYRLGFSLFAAVIALCIGLPAVTSSSGPETENQLEQSGNTLCRASLSATHHMIGFPMLLQMLGRSDADWSVLSLDKWGRTSSSAPAVPVSRFATDGS